MHRRLLVCLALALTGACAVTAAPAPEFGAAEVQVRPGFEEWGTGDGGYAYHRLTGTCETLTHAHGRNAAWGLWRMPVWKVTDSGPEEAENGGAQLRFACADGSACIEAGALDDTPDRVTEHVIPFETMDRARTFSARVAGVKAACARTY
ncbi:hypothetical protein [Hyphomonas sp.]|uniref:hypothetical protein n=1 Tax=Hyphomonas sp. TaxID=87 RepID=UPI0039190712